MYSRNPWEQDDPTAPNYGAANYGQLQPQDAPAAPQGPPGYQQPPAQWTPQARMFQGQVPAAPAAQVDSGRDQDDPTKMAGAQGPVTAPTSQGGLAPTQGMGPTPTGYNPPAPPEGIPNDPWKTADPSKLASNTRERALVMGQVDFTGPGRGGAQINPMAFRGFNDERALSAGDAKSAKDAFRDFIGQTDFDVRGLSKPETGEFLASKVVPFLESKGYPARVKPGEYDIIEVFSNERGWEPIDVIENAGSAEAAWQWGDRPGQAPQGPASGALNPDLLQQAAAGAGPEELAMAQSLGIDTNNPLWRQMFEAWFSNQESVDPTSFGLTPPRS